MTTNQKYRVGQVLVVSGGQATEEVSDPDGLDHVPHYLDEDERVRVTENSFTVTTDVGGHRLYEVVSLNDGMIQTVSENNLKEANE